MPTAYSSNKLKTITNRNTMPIKQYSVPWVFIPTLEEKAKCYLILEISAMIRHFLQIHGCPEDSGPRNHIQRVKKEINISERLFEDVASQNDLDHIELLYKLKWCLTSSRQKRYCKDVINSMAFYISNQAMDSFVTYKLNEFIDGEVEHTL